MFNIVKNACAISEGVKNKFKKGDKPTEVYYANFMDSYVHKSESLNLKI